MEWVSSRLSRLWHTVIPDNISCRKNQEYESDDISVVFHAIASAFFDILSKIIRSFRPCNQKQPIASPNFQGSHDVLLGFAGACMRLIFRKSDIHTKKLIRNLQMTPEMKDLLQNPIYHQPMKALKKDYPEVGKC